VIAQNWLAHRVRRFHSNQHLAHLGQTNADHAHGVASIIAMLHPAPSVELLKAALWHDAGERYAGDLPQPFKAEYPDIARQHSWAEDRLALRCAPLKPTLTPEEQSWLKLADSLEAIFFAAFHRPGLLKRDDWRDFVASMMKRAKELGVAQRVDHALTDMEEEGWV
jgi:5'-deoxynucleotidase YfbR-like HD superfamily hydrolase